MEELPQPIDPGSVLVQVEDSLLEQCYDTWFKDLWNDKRSVGGNKLRTYRTFKSDLNTEFYISCNMPYKYRKALATFRCGVAPLQIETGRYYNIPLNERLCELCNTGVIEDEMHAILECPAFRDVRRDLFCFIEYIHPEFPNLPDCDKLKFILSNEKCAFRAAKTCFQILDSRKRILCK